MKEIELYDAIYDGQSMVIKKMDGGGGMKKQNNIYIVGKRKMPRGFFYLNKNTAGEKPWHDDIYFWDCENLFFWSYSTSEFVLTLHPIKGEEFELIRGLA